MDWLSFVNAVCTVGIFVVLRSQLKRERLNHVREIHRLGSAHFVEIQSIQDRYGAALQFERERFAKLAQEID